MRRLMWLAALLLPGVPTGPRELAAQETSGLKWVVAPAVLPRGAMIAVVSGDPTAPGHSTIQLAMPDGYTMPPHYHPMEERVQVPEGTLLVGMGDKLDPKQTLALAVGDTIVPPAGFHHFSIAKGATVVQVTFEGPYIITYVHEYQAPRSESFPYKP